MAIDKHEVKNSPTRERKRLSPSPSPSPPSQARPPGNDKKPSHRRSSDRYSLPSSPSTSPSNRKQSAKMLESIRHASNRDSNSNARHKLNAHSSHSRRHRSLSPPPHHPKRRSLSPRHHRRSSSPSRNSLPEKSSSSLRHSPPIHNDSNSHHRHHHHHPHRDESRSFLLSKTKHPSPSPPIRHYKRKSSSPLQRGKNHSPSSHRYKDRSSSLHQSDRRKYSPSLDRKRSFSNLEKESRYKEDAENGKNVKSEKSFHVDDNDVVDKKEDENQRKRKSSRLEEGRERREIVNGDSDHKMKKRVVKEEEEEDGDEEEGEERQERGINSEIENVVDSVSRMENAKKELEEKEKQKKQPTFELSGKLAEETNKVRGIALLFSEPPDAKKPSVKWRLYIFKDGQPLKEPLHIHRQSCYLLGRERKIADIPTDHPSCSKQHAVIQFRNIPKEDENFNTKNVVTPYVMDLGSTNGTHLNGERIEPQRYYELFEKDTLKFGNSSREYVLLHEHSAG